MDSLCLLLSGCPLAQWNSGGSAQLGGATCRSGSSRRSTLRCRVPRAEEAAARVAQARCGWVERGGRRGVGPTLKTHQNLNLGLKTHSIANLPYLIYTDIATSLPLLGVYSPRMG